LRKIHFLAQVIHESAHLRATKEYDGANASYAPYFGRGLMQLTHKGNYKSYGSYIGIDVHSTNSNRKKLESDPHAAKSAGWYWSIKAKLNDEADSNDLLAVTYKVNGGFNGFKDRLRILKNSIKLFNLEDSVSSTFSFENSWIYNKYKPSLAWGMWHDSGSNKYKSKYCDASNAEAKKGYKRFLKIIKDESITFPQTKSNGKTRYFYGHSNPKTYAEERLKVL